jgi:hypothetical protein
MNEELNKLFEELKLPEFLRNFGFEVIRVKYDRRLWLAQFRRGDLVLSFSCDILDDMSIYIGETESPVSACNYERFLHAIGRDTTLLIKSYGGWDKGGFLFSDWSAAFEIFKESFPIIAPQLSKLYKQISTNVA